MLFCLQGKRNSKEHVFELEPYHPISSLSCNWDSQCLANIDCTASAIFVIFLVPISTVSVQSKWMLGLHSWDTGCPLTFHAARAWPAPRTQTIPVERLSFGLTCQDVKQIWSKYEANSHVISAKRKSRSTSTLLENARKLRRADLKYYLWHLGKHNLCAKSIANDAAILIGQRSQRSSAIVQVVGSSLERPARLQPWIYIDTSRIWTTISWWSVDDQLLLWAFHSVSWCFCMVSWCFGLFSSGVKTVKTVKSRFRRTRLDHHGLDKNMLQITEACGMLLPTVL